MVPDAANFRVVKAWVPVVRWRIWTHEVVEPYLERAERAVEVQVGVSQTMLIKWSHGDQNSRMVVWLWSTKDQERRHSIASLSAWSSVTPSHMFIVRRWRRERCIKLRCSSRFCLGFGAFSSFLHLFHSAFFISPTPLQIHIPYLLVLLSLWRRFLLWMRHAVHHPHFVPSFLLVEFEGTEDM